MKIRTHYHIARMAWESLPGRKQPGVLCKILFCIGSMLPDFSPGQLVHPHFYEASYPYIFRQMTPLFFRGTGKISLFHFLRIGRIAHYLSDFCCMAHREGHLNHVWQHMRYERLENRFFLRNLEAFRPGKMMPSRKIFTILQEYRQVTKQLGSSFIFDIEKSIQVCSALLQACGLQSSANIEVERYRSPVSGSSTTTVLPAFSARKPY